MKPNERKKAVGEGNAVMVHFTNSSQHFTLIPMRFLHSVLSLLLSLKRRTDLLDVSVQYMSPSCLLRQRSIEISG